MNMQDNVVNPPQTNFVPPTVQKPKSKTTTYILITLIALFFLLVPGVLTYFLLSRDKSRGETVVPQQQVETQTETEVEIETEEIEETEQETIPLEQEEFPLSQRTEAAQEVELALWAYYSDNREFPHTGEQTELQCQADYSPQNLLSNNGLLSNFIEGGEFDGRANVSFWYFWANQGQEFIICATINEELDIYCTGNGIASNLLGEAPVNNVFTQEHGSYTKIRSAVDCRSDWDSGTKDWR